MEKRTTLPKSAGPCPHGFYNYCPQGCFQTEFELAISEFMQSKTPDTVGSLTRLRDYKYTEARQLTFELSTVMKEITDIEERLEKARRKENGPADPAI